MCEICAKRKGEVALFLSEHAPQLGIKSAAAQLAWSELNALAVEVALAPDTPDQPSAAENAFSERGTKIMAALSLAELEEIFFAATTVWMTGNLHRMNASAMLKSRWRAGERDPNLSPEAIQSIEAGIARDTATTNMRDAIANAIAQTLDGKILEQAAAPKRPNVTVFVPGSGKPVPPS